MNALKNAINKPKFIVSTSQWTSVHMGAFVVTNKPVSVPFKTLSNILGQEMTSELTAIALEHLVPVLDAIEDPRVFSQAEIRSVLEEEGHAYATSFFQQLGLVTSRVKGRTVPLDSISTSAPSGSQGSTASADVNIPDAQAQPKAEATSAATVFEFLNLVLNVYNRYSLGKKNWEIVL